jgi:carbon monoxide dehydrogenase subunit G
MSSTRVIPAPPERVWAALNDPDTLKQCIPGCESLVRESDTHWRSVVAAKVGPVAARFNGSLKLADVNPPSGYTLRFKGQGGAAGFANGEARVALSPADAGRTTLAYTATAQVGGKLAQIGSRLVDAAAKKVADDFFRNFNEKVGALHPQPAVHHEKEEHHPEPVPRDPDLPDVSQTTLMFFAAGALVVGGVALVVLL